MAHNLKGTAAKLAKLVQEHGTYEFEGFKWLDGTLIGIADHLGVKRLTIHRAIQHPPFKYLQRWTKEDGKHVLIRIGDGDCETDRVYVLRAIWAKGLVYFNAALGVQLRMRAEYLKSVGADQDLYHRILHRIEKADEGATNLDKLKAGQKISLDVLPAHMGQLRGIVQMLGEDAPSVIACLVTHEGWTTFCAYLKAEGRLDRHYHWPNPGVILKNPDLALQTYLDMQQASAKIDPAKATKLFVKIKALEPKDAA